jgi:large subunit ribosomal protein L13
MDKTHLIASRGVRLYHLVDAKNEVLGRLAPQVARLLAGKHKPTYTPSRDAGDWVVVVNAKEVALTGNKREQKLYQWHTGWPGGLKTLTARQVFERDPRRVVTAAVKGMLAPNLLRRDRLRRLRVFPGEAHGMEAALAASRAYAGEHLDAHRPVSHQPRERERGEAANWESAPAATEEELRGLTFKDIEPSAEAAGELQKWREEQVRRRQAYQDAMDLRVLHNVIALDRRDAKRAAAAAAAAGGGGGSAAGGKPAPVAAAADEGSQRAAKPEPPLT